MKILFIISVHGHGNGGHFHSLNHISQIIGKYDEVKIISIGPGRSRLLESNPYFYKHINFNVFNFLSLVRAIKKVRKEFDPNIYHCFDVGCYNVIRLLISSRKNVIVLSKCGGGNPLKFPKVHNLILFSLENQSWFEHNNKFKNTNIYLIPNRVDEIKLYPGFRPVSKNQCEFVFVRICRIGKSYEKSICDSVRLIELLLKTIRNVKLYVIGVVEDSDLFEKLEKINKLQNIVFLTDAVYTSEAAKMLYLADAVIGTGRGLMEAASLGKPILAIDSSNPIPILLDSSNFNDGFKTNFSERNQFSKICKNNNLFKIRKLILDKKYYQELSSFSKLSFDKHFAIDSVPSAYHAVYEKGKKGGGGVFGISLLYVSPFMVFFEVQN